MKADTSENRKRISGDKIGDYGSQGIFNRSGAATTMNLSEFNQTNENSCKYLIIIKLENEGIMLIYGKKEQDVIYQILSKVFNISLNLILNFFLV